MAGSSNRQMKTLVIFSEHISFTSLKNIPFKPQCKITGSFYCCCSVMKSCPTLGDPMDCGTQGPSVLYYLPEFAQIHVRWVNDAIDHLILCCPLLLLLSIFPSIRVFTNESALRIRGPKYCSLNISSSMNIQSWFPLGLTGLISLKSKGLSRVFSSTTIWKHWLSAFFGCLLYGLTLTSTHDYWKNHSFDYMDLCQQSDVTAF